MACGNCPSGYANNGAKGCKDVNECASRNGGCDSKRRCINTAGSMACGNCPSGYTNNGAKGCKVATLPYGKYRITSNGHARGAQPKGWGLSAWNAHGAARNSASSWVAVHTGTFWPCDWNVMRGRKAGTYRINTVAHKAGNQPGGWGLSAWNAHGAARNSVSSRVAVHSGETWYMDWKIIPGKVAGTWRVMTTAHGPGKQPAGWGLTAWQNSGGKRNSGSSWVFVHKPDSSDWITDWIFTKIG